MPQIWCTDSGFLLPAGKRLVTSCAQHLAAFISTQAHLIRTVARAFKKPHLQGPSKLNYNCGIEKPAPFPRGTQKQVGRNGLSPPSPRTSFLHSSASLFGLSIRKGIDLVLILGSGANIALQILIYWLKCPPTHPSLPRCLRPPRRCLPACGR